MRFNFKRLLAGGTVFSVAALLEFSRPKGWTLFQLSPKGFSEKCRLYVSYLAPRFATSFSP